MGSPAIAKNVLAVGASTSGPGRLTWTGQDGGATNGKNRVQNIDAMAYFSSFGPSLDGRIKPEVVAPGDLVSASMMCRSPRCHCGRNSLYEGTPCFHVVRF